MNKNIIENVMKLGEILESVENTTEVIIYKIRYLKTGHDKKSWV